MYILQLPNSEKIQEAVVHAENLQDLFKVLLDNEYEARSKSSPGFIGEPFSGYYLPPEGDYFKNGTILDMPSLEEHIEKAVQAVELKIRKDWSDLLDNTLDVKTLIRMGN